MKYVYKTLVLILLSLIIVVFTNCGKPSTLIFENGNVTTTSNTSSSSSIQGFETTVYPITRANCISCHDSSIQPFHASDSVVLAHDSLINLAKVNFTTPSSSRIVKKLRENQHNCWTNCEDNAAEMENAIIRWAQFAGTTADASAETVVTGKTTFKSLPIAQELTAATNTTVTLPGSNPAITGKRISFNINELLDNPTGGDFFFTVELYNYDDYTYQLINPRIVVPAGTAAIPLKRIFVRNIRIVMNDVVKSEHPIWTSIERRTSATTATILSTSSMLASKVLGNAQDRISFNFQQIEVDNRTPQQLSLDAFEKSVYVVTRENCSSCHTSNQSPLHASLNLQTAHDASLNLVNFNNIPQSTFVTKIQNGHRGIDRIDVPAAFQLAIDQWRINRTP